LDTGASISLIALRAVEEKTKILKSETSVEGIGGKLKILGKIGIKWEQSTIQFYVVDRLPVNAGGILGNNFLTQFKAIINYETFEVSVKPNNKLRFSIAMTAADKTKITLPPRCEVFRYCETTNSEDSVVFPIEICEGVFTAGALVRPREKKKFL